MNTKQQNEHAIQQINTYLNQIDQNTKLLKHKPEILIPNIQRTTNHIRHWIKQIKPNYQIIIGENHTK